MKISRLLIALVLSCSVHLSAWQERRAGAISMQRPPEPSQIAALEQQLSAKPDDLDVLAQLLRLYADAAPQAREDYRAARLRHIEFLIDEHPADPLAGSSLCYVGNASGPYANPSDHASVTARWLAEANQLFDDDKVLLNALRFLSVEDKPQGEDLFKRAIAARPPGSAFSSRLGFFYAAGLVGADTLDGRMLVRPPAETASTWSDHCRAELEITQDPHVLMGTAIALPNLAMRRTGGGPVYESSVAASEEFRRRASALDPGAAKGMPVEFQMFAEESTAASQQASGQPAAGPLNVNGNVPSVVPISTPRPTYPPLALQAGVQGTVRLQVSIGPDGAVTNIQLISGPPLLVQAAVSAVQTWRYQPTLANGVPVAVTTRIEMPFTLP